MHERIETVIVGGGQAGLALSFYLSHLGREHVILERGRVAERWRTERWDSLMFQFPNWAIKLPGRSYQTNDPNGFSSKNDVIRFVEGYATQISAPVRTGVNVLSVQQKPHSERLLISTVEGTIEAKNVVIAIGPYHIPAVPTFASSFPTSVFQVHSRDYRNPEQLPPGAVFVVGSGASGLQIAEELHAAGRQVYLSVGSHQRTPRRYAGRDVYWWLDALGILKQPFDQRTDARRFCLHVTGVGGGHDINLRILASRGMILIGELRAVVGEKLIIAPGLREHLVQADAAYEALKVMMRDLAQQNGWNLSGEVSDEEPTANLPAATRPIEEIDLANSGIKSVLWCCGFRSDFGIIKAPVLNGSDCPVHQRGKTCCPGLYFLGLRDLYTMSSSHLAGVGDDAAFIARDIATRP
jgi:putative flavoprotein involved in K+ transport